MRSLSTCSYWLTNPWSKSYGIQALFVDEISLQFMVCNRTNILVQGMAQIYQLNVTLQREEHTSVFEIKLQVYHRHILLARIIHTRDVHYDRNTYSDLEVAFNPLVLGDLNGILLSNFQAKFRAKLPWNECHCANVGSGNGLVPSGNKPLHEPMLTQIYVAIWRHELIQSRLQTFLQIVKIQKRHIP